MVGPCAYLGEWAFIFAHLKTQMWIFNTYYKESSWIHDHQSNWNIKGKNEKCNQASEQIVHSLLPKRNMNVSEFIKGEVNSKENSIAKSSPWKFLNIQK